MKTVSVGSSIDSSQKLQNLINTAGNTPTEFIFSTNDIEIASPVKFFPGVKLSGNNTVFRLKDHISTSIFPSMTPVIGSKVYGGTGFEFSGLTFDGNSNNQTTILGKGFHNFIGLSGASGISIHDCHIHDSMGDGARLTNVKNVNYYKNKIVRCGHDAVYIDKGQNIDVFDNYVELRTNSGCRLRHVDGGHVHGNYIINKNGGRASSPGMQVENSTSGMSSRNIIIENNDVHDTWGPGIWIIGTSNKSVSAASGLTVRNNLFSNCGNMDSDYHHIPGVGGITCEGWDDVVVEQNTFSRCLGYGVLFGEYVSVSASGSGYSAVVKNNIFNGTKRSNTVGTASGTALCNLKPQKYTKVIAQGNSYSGNVRDLYNVVEKPEPVIENPAFLMFDCSENELKTIKEKYPRRTILRRA